MLFHLFIATHYIKISFAHPGAAFRDSGTPGGVPRDVDRLFFLPYIPFNAVDRTSERKHHAETIESECHPRNTGGPGPLGFPLWA